MRLASQFRASALLIELEMKAITIDVLLNAQDVAASPFCTTNDEPIILQPCRRSAIRKKRMSIQDSAGFRTAAACLLGAFTLLVAPMESQAKHEISRKTLSAPQTRSYIPSQCGTMTLCTPARTPGKPLNGKQTCVNSDKRDIKIIVANWKHDLLEGYFWCANDDGIPQLEANYLHGELEGTYKEYDRTRKEWGFEQSYKNGKREGFARRKLNNGHFIVAFYKDGNRHGYELVVDAQNQIQQTKDCTIFGQRKAHEECENIAIPGFEKALDIYKADTAKVKAVENNRVVESKYPNGQVHRRYQLVNGQIDGKYEIFFSNGNSSTIALYNDGRKYEEAVYFEEGQMPARLRRRDQRKIR